jgi:dienelactone hydrolase
MHMRHHIGNEVALSCLLAVTATLALGAEPVLQPVGVIGAPAGTGKWPAVAEAREDLRSHTFYRPQQMPDTPLPVLIWGNGGCSDNGLSHSIFLREVASHGYFIIALGYPRTEPVARPPNAQGPARPPGPPPGGAPPGVEQRRGQIGGGGALPTDPNETDATVVAQMNMALDWATAMNELSSSKLQGRLDMTRVAVAGHSCGGLQTIKFSADPRIKTSMIFDSGVYNVPGGMSRVKVSKFDLYSVHGPTAYITGGPTDQAHPNAMDDASRIKHVPVFLGWLPVGHGGTFSQPNGGDWASIAVNWLNWQLKADASAGKWFLGADCGYCKDARWKVEFNPKR